MANLTQTSANVAAGSDTGTTRVQVGEAVTEGQPGYQATTGKYLQADASVVTTAAATGVFLTPAALDGYAIFATSGLINLGATLAVGETYVVSATKGAIAPIGDLTTGEFVTPLGIAISTSELRLVPRASGIAKA